MLRRWVRGLLTAVIVSFVVTSAVAQAAAPLIDLLPDAALTADIGTVRVVVGL